MPARIAVWLLLVTACALPSQRTAVVVAPPPDEIALTPEDRVEQELEALAAFCSAHPGECEAHGRPDVYPDVQVPEATARFLDERAFSVRSLGFTLRWDPGSSRYSVSRGNTPTWNSDAASDR